MSFLNQSGDLASFTEVVPQGAQFGSPERSSILTMRRRARVTPQTGPSLGSAGAGAGGQQIQYLLSDMGGMLDMRSIVLNYTIQTSGASTPCPDDGHPFSVVQILLNGQLVENIQNAPKLANIEMTMGASQTYYRTAGSLQGFELLNPDLVTNVPSSSTTASITAWGYVVGNQPSIATRSSRSAAAVFNNIAGEQRSIPLGLVCGFGRLKQYLPISLLGEVSIVLVTGQPGEVLFTTSSSTAGDYSLSNMNVEFDVVIPDARFQQVLQKVAMEDGQGLVIPYESSIVTTGGAMASSSTLSEYSLIVSRATNNLLRSNVVLIPSALISSINYPSQSAFSHGGVFSFQQRVGSVVFPQVAAQGDASIFNMSLCAYGSALQEHGTITNRCLWGNSTNGATAGTPAVYETADASTGGSVKFAYADRFVPSYGYAVVKGASEPLEVDGISLAGASGSQLITTLVAAPGIAYTPYIVMTALRFVKAQGGAVSIVGA